ncbi:hypothetical protein ABW19_dt0200881 [Dactylella cylindrospora]|nr:hypothetical protein ABW19_dt0200881 [Dactylella cylindrospora]
MSSSAVSHAAAVAAIKEVEANGSLDPTPITFDLKQEPLQSTGLTPVEGQPDGISDYPSPPSSFPTHGVSALSTGFRKSGFGSTILTESVPENVGEQAENESGLGKTLRRLSDGPDDGHSAKGELKCEHCGKGYKHSSCLTKHLWEHTPEWSYTSKLLISKHQQVQLLEAASILVSMKPNTPPASASSTASYGMMNDSPIDSNSEDSPPPTSERFSSPQPASGRSRAVSSAGQPMRRHGSHSRAAVPYSRSYQPPPMGSSFGGKSITPVASPSSMRPTQVPSGLLSPRSVSGQQDDESLAAAVQMLSCSFGGTPVLGPTKPSGKSGNVPPLPLASPPNDFRGLGSPRTLKADYITSNPVAQQSEVRGTAGRFSNYRDEDVDMDDSDHDSNGRALHSSSYRSQFNGPEVVLEDNDEEDRPTPSSLRWSERTRGKLHDEDEDGVFGKMEE